MRALIALALIGVVASYGKLLLKVNLLSKFFNCYLIII